MTNLYKSVKKLLESSYYDAIVAVHLSYHLSDEEFKKLCFSNRSKTKWVYPKEVLFFSYFIRNNKVYWLEFGYFCYDESNCTHDKMINLTPKSETK